MKVVNLNLSGCGKVNLDDLNQIRAIDRFNMVEAIETMPEQLIDALNIAYASNLEGVAGKDFANVIIAGVGGSAIGGDIIVNWISDKVSVPIHVCRDYRIPAYANEDTFVIAVSYSGETEETLKVLLEAYERGCVLAAVFSGGKMEEISEKFNMPSVKVRRNLQPRAALPYLFSPLAVMLEKCGLIENLREEVNLTVGRLNELRGRIGLLTPMERNSAKQLAARLVGRIPVIYSLKRTECLARRLKNQFNENSKVPAKYDCLPEACHNEVEGWQNSMLEGTPPFFIFIRDSEESEDEAYRMEEMEKAVTESGVAEVSEVYCEAETRLARLFTGIYYGDYLSFYLAAARGVDPTPINRIQKLKERISARTKFEKFLEEKVKKLGN
jgi:glucose/mannose-6-phosphate isomerase